MASPGTAGHPNATLPNQQPGGSSSHSSSNRQLPNDNPIAPSVSPSQPPKPPKRPLSTLLLRGVLAAAIAAVAFAVAMDVAELGGWALQSWWAATASASRLPVPVALGAQVLTAAALIWASIGRDVVRVGHGPRSRAGGRARGRVRFRTETQGQAQEQSQGQGLGSSSPDAGASSSNPTGGGDTAGSAAGGAADRVDGGSGPGLGPPGEAATPTAALAPVLSRGTETPPAGATTAVASPPQLLPYASVLSMATWTYEFPGISLADLARGHGERLRRLVEDRQGRLLVRVCLQPRSSPSSSSSSAGDALLPHINLRTLALTLDVADVSNTATLPPPTIPGATAAPAAREAIAAAAASNLSRRSVLVTVLLSAVALLSRRSRSRHHPSRRTPRTSPAPAAAAAALPALTTASATALLAYLDAALLDSADAVLAFLCRVALWALGVPVPPVGGSGPTGRSSIASREGADLPPWAALQWALVYRPPWTLAAWSWWLRYHYRIVAADVYLVVRLCLSSLFAFVRLCCSLGAGVVTLLLDTGTSGGGGRNGGAGTGGDRGRSRRRRPALPVPQTRLRQPQSQPQSQQQQQQLVAAPWRLLAAAPRVIRGPTPPQWTPLSPLSYAPSRVPSAHQPQPQTQPQSAGSDGAASAPAAPVTQEAPVPPEPPRLRVLAAACVGRAGSGGRCTRDAGRGSGCDGGSGCDTADDGGGYDSNRGPERSSGVGHTAADAADPLVALLSGAMWCGLCDPPPRQSSLPPAVTKSGRDSAWREGAAGPLPSAPASCAAAATPVPAETGLTPAPSQQGRLPNGPEGSAAAGAARSVGMTVSLVSLHVGRSCRRAACAQHVTAQYEVLLSNRDLLDDQEAREEGPGEYAAAAAACGGPGCELLTLRLSLLRADGSAAYGSRLVPVVLLDDPDVIQELQHALAGPGAPPPSSSSITLGGGGISTSSAWSHIDSLLLDFGVFVQRVARIRTAAAELAQLAADGALRRRGGAPLGDLCPKCSRGRALNSTPAPAAAATVTGMAAALGASSSALHDSARPRPLCGVKSEQPQAQLLPPPAPPPPQEGCLACAVRRADAAWRQLPADPAPGASLLALGEALLRHATASGWTRTASYITAAINDLHRTDNQLRAAAWVMPLPLPPAVAAGNRDTARDTGSSAVTRNGTEAVGVPLGASGAGGSTPSTWGVLQGSRKGKAAPAAAARLSAWLLTAGWLRRLSPGQGDDGGARPGAAAGEAPLHRGPATLRGWPVSALASLPARLGLPGALPSLRSMRGGLVGASSVGGPRGLVGDFLVGACVAVLLGCLLAWEEDWGAGGPGGGGGGASGALAHQVGVGGMRVSKWMLVVEVILVILVCGVVGYLCGVVWLGLGEGQRGRTERPTGSRGSGQGRRPGVGREPWRPVWRA